MSNVQLTAKDCFCKATIEKYGEAKLNRFIRLAISKLSDYAGTSDPEMQQKLLTHVYRESAEEVFGDGSTVAMQDLITEMKHRTSGHQSAHGTGQKSTTELKRRRYN